MIIDFKRVPDSGRVYDAIVVGQKTTQLGHIALECEEISEIYEGGEPVRRFCRDFKHFTVPKRRKKLMNFVKNLKQYQAIRILQLKEIRSKNYTVAEIQIL